MTTRGFVIAAALVLFAVPSTAATQHSYGDGFGVGGVLLPSGSSVLLGTTRIGSTLGIEFALGLRASDDGHLSTANIGATVGLKRFLTDQKQFQPYYGGRFGFQHSSKDNEHTDERDTRFGVTAVLGGEYFIIRSLSFQGEIGFDLYFGSIDLGTSTRLAALFYL